MLCLIVSFDLIQMKWYVTYVYLITFFFNTSSGHIKRFPRKKRTRTTHVPEKNKT